MDRITDVVIDLDGVVYPFASAFKSYCVNVLDRHPAELPYPTRWEFYEDWNMTKDEFHSHIAIGARDHQLFANFPAEYYADHAWKKFREMGLTIHVMTLRPKEAQRQTMDWLVKHNIQPDYLWFPEESKGDLIRHIDGSVIAIDDHVENYLEIRNTGSLAVLHTQPWNTHYKKALRVNNLRNFVKLIEIFNSEEVIK